MINFSIRASEQVNLNIFNIQGQLVKSLVAEEKNAGSYSIKWQGETSVGGFANSGIYFCRLQVGNNISLSKILKID
jgi:flagellar hook assembly protein FlgD